MKTADQWRDEDLVMISAIEHYSYCPRQCALIHVEQIFDENIYTLRGRVAHNRVDQPGSTMEEGTRIERALPLWSVRLGLVGKADVVEFYDNTPYPVDYKHGPKRIKEHDDLQLCAIAMCLEEMIGHPVPKGAIYHVSSRRRREVIFNNDMRNKVEIFTVQIREMIDKGIVPPAEHNEKCRNCSLLDACLPEVVDPGKKRMRFFLQRLFKPMEDE